ncbi:MAG: polysaccharide deacetylase family protein [Corynebacteriales bacterium]|nr:polysaccharide deacetylase family protein [Mycobacteriales bacterium]
MRKLLAIISLLFLFAVSACGGKEPRAQAEPEQRSTPKVERMAAPPNAYAAQIPPFRRAPLPERVVLPDDGVHAPLIKRVPTNHKVAFITIDDGNKRLPEAHELFRAPNTPASAFLVSKIAAEDPAYFERLKDDGMPIEAHSVNHIKLRGLSYEAQKAEICGSVDALEQMMGKRPTLFRPPYGEYDKTTLRAARDCGIKAVLYWTQSVTDGNVYYQTPEKKVLAGDIILLHFRDAIVGDILATLQAIYDSGLTPALLEDYLG